MSIHLQCNQKLKFEKYHLYYPPPRIEIVRDKFDLVGGGGKTKNKKTKKTVLNL